MKKKNAVNINKNFVSWGKTQLIRLVRIYQTDKQQTD